MAMDSGTAIHRRLFLMGASSFAAATAWPGGAGAAPSPQQFQIVAGAGRWPLVDTAHKPTGVWCYGGQIPGPEIRVRQNEPVRIVVENRLDEDTTVHWHGVRLPNTMDGVPGLTQPPIKPGDTFTYEFTPPDAGTFWYHPHADTLRQLGRGLAGVLVVEEAKPFPVDREVTWVLADWRLAPDAQIVPGFGNAMEAAMAGRVGNIVSLNGAQREEVPVRAGERIRLRLVNTSLARIMALRFENHHPVVIAVDGQPCDPHEPDGGRLLLGPAMRIDVVLDMQGKPGERYRVVDDFYPDISYWLTHLAYDDRAAVEPGTPKHPLALPRNPLPEPNLDQAERHVLTLQGGMMGGGMMGMGGKAAWAINGKSMTGDGHAGMPPLLTLNLGRSYVLTMRNETAWWHPMHLHGLSFRILSRNGRPVPYRQWADTVLVAPRETVDVAFVADNPGDWMLHCHVIDHQMSGLMTVLRIA
ncbi:MAG: multicopper oxidase domain-containing protein [Rhodopseudomonas sp.]|nr:multicopper oxidase domain-containing protein [Rhodopseudomonas sp.]